MTKKALLVKDCAEAMDAAKKMGARISSQDMASFMNATIDHDGKEWWIAAGPNMVSDRHGFGQTIKEAVENYFEYLNNLH